MYSSITNILLIYKIVNLTLINHHNNQNVLLIIIILSRYITLEFVIFIQDLGIRRFC